MQRERANRSRTLRQRPLHFVGPSAAFHGQESAGEENRPIWSIEPEDIFERIRPSLAQAYLGRSGNWARVNVQSDRIRRLWDAYLFNAEFEADRWLLEEQARQMEALREMMRNRRRAGHQQEPYAEPHRRDFARTKESNERATREWEERDAAAVWQEYEATWQNLLTHRSSPDTDSTASDVLSFHTIPWPMFENPEGPEDITPGRVAAFLLSTSHSTDVRRKERIREALRRWHPDRFKPRVLGRVTEREREGVEEGAGKVARILNDLLARETKLKFERAA